MEQREGRRAVILLAVLMALSGLVAVAVLVRLGPSAPRPGRPPQPEDPFSESGVSEQRRVSELQARLNEPSRAAVEQQSSLALATRLSPPAESPPSAPAPAARTPELPRESPEASVGEAERKLVESAIGARWNEDQARSLGSRQGLMFRVGMRLLRYPRALRFILDQPLVAQGLVRQRRLRQLCGDVSALERYLVDDKDMGGVRLSARSLKAALDHPGAVAAVFGTRSMMEIITQCPTLKEITRDSVKVGEIVSRNPELLGLATDARLLTELAASPLALDIYQGVQSSLGRP